MQLIKKTKKGFTLVELIVVIAIVAILAAVSVVSYIAFINSANESADISLVKQLNLALQADEALHGKRSTMHEMLLDMEENGFVVENLTKTKSGYDIVWDQEHNRFGLFDGEKKIYGESSLSLDHEQYIWKFVDSKAEADAITNSTKFYSMYLTEAYINEAVRTIEVKSGIDVGINEITELTYNHTSGTGQTVTIRTNSEGTRVNVNGKQGNDGDTVKHYGVAANVFENSCGKKSYDEYGYIVGFIFSQDGHVHVYSKSDSNISASAVVVVNTNVTIDVDDETPVIYAGLTQEQIAEVQANISAENNTYVVGGVTPVYNEQDLANSSGGIGTDVSPFIIATPEKFKELLNNSTGQYFKLFKDIVIDLSQFSSNSNKSFIQNFNGYFNGNGKNIIITNTQGKVYSDYSIINKGKGNLSNFTIVNNATRLVSILSGKDITQANEELTSMLFENVNYGYEGIEGTINLEEDNCGLFSQSGVDNITFINCNIYYDIYSTAKYVGLFVGGRVNQYHPNDTKLSFEKCNYYGNAFGGGSLGILIGNTNENRTVENVIIKNCSNFGNLSAFSTVGFFGTGKDQPQDIPGLLEAYVSELHDYGTTEKLTSDGSDLSISSLEYIIKKGSTNPDMYEFRLYESLKLYNNETGTEESGLFVDALSFRITIQIHSETLEFDGDGKAKSGYKVSQYTTYDYWKAHYNSNNEYVGIWSSTDEGVPYFYDYTNARYVINLNDYVAVYKQEKGLDDNYVVSGTATGIANISMFAYKDGAIVAFKSLGANPS